MNLYEHLLGARCALIEQDRLAAFEVTGADRVRFLQGRMTCDVAAPAAGRGVYGFFPQLKGRILADASVLVEDERLIVELPAEEREAICAHLEKYILIDQVSLRPLAETFLAVLGPMTADVIDHDLPPDPRQHLSTRIYGVSCRLVRLPDFGMPTIGLRVAEEDAEELRKHLGRALENLGGIVADQSVWDRLRIAAGRPLYGRDFNAENFPQELEPWPPGDEDAVSYTKGCYLGQEVIARIHYRGGVNKHLRGVLFDADADPDSDPGADPGDGVEVIHDGRPAGRLTGTALLRERRLGLAMLHDRVEPGMRVEAGGLSGEVLARPFTFDSW